MNHRALQRTLFRMQLDPKFAQRIDAGEERALATTDLIPTDITVLRRADIVAVSADKNDQRRRQALGNLLTETPYSALYIPPADLYGFFADETFHDAIRRDERLPPAFADYLARNTRGMVHALVRLEAAMTRMRRRDLRRDVDDSEPSTATLRDDAIILHPRIELAVLPAGTLETAETIRRATAAKDQDETPPTLGAASDETEVVMIQATPSPHPHRLHEVAVERLEPLVADLLAAARKPMSRATRDAYAATNDADPNELEAFVDSLVEDLVVVRTGE